MALLDEPELDATAAPAPPAQQLPDEKLVEQDASTADPFVRAAAAGAQGLDRAAAADGSYEVFSIEDFPDGIGDLGATHEDAGGFHDYVAQFTAPNYWFRDGGVLGWAYGEDFDNWQDLYGFDSACAVYHSGHGNMDSAGVFQCPMGGEWGGASWVFSNGMTLGNERARYLFWSTCLSLRVLDGMSPITTWHGANGGIRMLFGFETTSVDNGDYGRFFFQEWNANKSFSQAWLDASWRIDHTQAPSVMACGTDQTDAESRLYNERQFFRDPGSTNWYSWRWYDAATVMGSRPRTISVPDRLAVATITAASARPEELGERFGLRLAPTSRSGRLPRLLMGEYSHVAIKGDGSYEVRLRPPAAPGHQPDATTTRAAAHAAIQSFGLAEDVDLVFDQARNDMIAGGTPEGDGSMIEPRVRETVVHYRQVINGAPVITPGAGEVRVSVDTTGAVTAIADNTVRVSELVDRPAAAPAPAPASAYEAQPTMISEATVEDALGAATQRRLRRLSGGAPAAGHEVIPGSTQVGYSTDYQTGAAVLAARRTIEVDCGQSLRKRYVIQVPVVG